MKKVFVTLSLFSTVLAYGQKVSGKLTFAKGQKVEIVTNTNITAQSLMGPASGTITMSDVYTVNDVAENGITLVKTPKQIKIAFSSGAQEMKLDTDNPKDLGGPFGKPIKEIMNMKPEFTINANGKIIAVKSEEKQKKDGSPEAGMMGMMMPGMDMSAIVPQVGGSSVFQVLPGKEVAVGDSWTDSVNADGNKSVTLYKVKEINEKEVILDFEGSGTSRSTQSLMGQSIEVNASTKGTGTVVLDKATGIIKQKLTTNNTESAMNLAGQEITSTVKSSSVMNVSVQ